MPELWMQTISISLFTNKGPSMGQHEDCIHTTSNVHKTFNKHTINIHVYKREKVG